MYDREADGHGVYVKVVLDDGYDQVGDANGSDPPCSSRTYGRRRADQDDAHASTPSLGADWDATMAAAGRSRNPVEA